MQRRLFVQNSIFLEYAILFCRCVLIIKKQPQKQLVLVAHFLSADMKDRNLLSSLMIVYKSKSEKPSGVIAYQFGADFILIKFSNGNVYRYTNKSAGKTNIEKMKKLASEQMGLSTFIAQKQPVYERIQN